jgi:hypothetical protein
VIRSLSASANGEMLYFCAVGSVWAVQASGGETRAVTAGEYAVVDFSRPGLIVVRSESSHIRMLHVPLDGTGEQEIPLDRSLPLYGTDAGFFSSGSLDVKGRLLVALSPLDLWFNPLGMLDTDTGYIVRVTADSLSDYQSGVWTPDGQILYTQVPARANIWKFQPLDK